MVTPLLDELRSFQAFLARKIEERDTETLWRLEHPTPEEHEDAVQAIREGLKDIDEGRTIPSMISTERSVSGMARGMTSIVTVRAFGERPLATGEIESAIEISATNHDHPGE